MNGSGEVDAAARSLHESTSDTDRAPLACVDVTVRFGGLVAVKDANLTVPRATIVGLVGPNGAGKSTLFAVLSGLIRPTHGTVLLDGEDVTHRSPQVHAARGMARTFQHPELFTGLTIRDHLVLAHRVKHAGHRVWSDVFSMGSLHAPSGAEGDTVDGLLDLLNLRAAADRPALGLPLGQARLVELGRALATGPTVLLLDEPSSGLDTAETAELEHVLRRIADEKAISVLLVEHDVELVMRLSSRIYVLDFGHIIAEGTPARIRANPAVRAAYLGEEIVPAAPGPSEDVVQTGSAVSAALPDLVAVPAPRRRVGPAAVTAQTQRPGALVVDDLSIRYGDAVALNRVSFTLQPGKVLTVLGANGAGKSSLARALSGLVPSATGQIMLSGRDITDWPAYQIRRAGVVHLPEGRGIFRDLSVMDNLRMAAGTVHGRRQRRQAVDLALEIFPELADRRRQSAGLLSGGEQQMLSLARAFAVTPRIVIADEMSLGLAPKLVDYIFESLARAREAGISVLMIEQYVHRALGFADDCLVLHRGDVAYNGAARSAGGELLRHYLGEAIGGEA
jgi:ABC-type branched-subunit amino acid transport system ATPase component